MASVSAADIRRRAFEHAQTTSTSSSSTSASASTSAKAAAAAASQHGHYAAAHRNSRQKCVLVSPRQRGNVVLTHIQNVRWEFSQAKDMTADFVLGATTAALFGRRKHTRLCQSLLALHLLPNIHVLFIRSLPLTSISKMNHRLHPAYIGARMFATEY
jgi:hypothetical protein